MAFHPWNRWKSTSERNQLHLGALTQEIDRLCADPRVHGLFDWFSRHEREISEFQLAITSVAAPTFAEQNRAEWLLGRMQPLGLSTYLDAVGNLLAVRAGLHEDMRSGIRSEAPSVAISAHLDTVFPVSTELNIRREHTQLLGPGISDNGSGLAALWALASAFHASEIVTSLPLLFIANVGEEGDGNLQGMRHIYREYLGQAGGTVPDETQPPAIALLLAIDGAGTDNIISEALGSRRFEIVIEGPGGHSWSDHGMPNPIVAASILVEMLARIQLPTSPRATLNVGTIEGGTSVNAIPERAVLKVDIRSSEPNRLDILEQRIRQAAADACFEAQTLSANPHARLQLRHNIARVGERPSGELSATSPLLTAVRAVDTQLGIKSQILRASTDVNIPLSLGLEAVALGAGGSGGGAHTLREWFDPIGREQALKRLSLLILLVAGLPPAVTPRQNATTPQESV